MYNYIEYGKNKRGAGAMFYTTTVQSNGNIITEWYYDQEYATKCFRNITEIDNLISINLYKIEKDGYNKKIMQCDKAKQIKKCNCYVISYCKGKL